MSKIKVGWNSVLHRFYICVLVYNVLFHRIFRSLLEFYIISLKKKTDSAPKNDENFSTGVYNGRSARYFTINK
jgi:hypothetical protein